MDAVQAQTIGKATYPRAVMAGIASTALIVVIAALAFALLGGKGAETVSTPARLADPFADPAVVSFRQSEHAEAVQPWTGDPLANPAVIEFRNSEPSEVALPTWIEFRNRERSEVALPTWTADPLANPAVIEFRNSEHTEATE